jgi:hypothetical protein
MAEQIPGLPANICGMPAVLNYLAEHPVGDIDGPIVPHRKKLSDILPNKDDWWHIYLDRQHHKEALIKSPNDPGLLYDTQESKGFKACMLNVYTQVLDDNHFADVFSTGDLDFSHYSELFDFIKASVKRYKPRTDNEAVRFGMMPGTLANDLLTELVNKRPLLTDSEHYLEMNPLAYIVAEQNKDKDILVNGNTEMAEGPILINLAFESFKAEINLAATRRMQLRAIARLIRILHVLHYWSDGNGRLHCYVLLPRLLLQYGFGPPLKLGTSCVTDTLFGLFNGCFNLDQIVGFLWNAQQLDSNFEPL